MQFVINLTRTSTHWPHRGVKMDTSPGFAPNVDKGYRLISWVVQSGYRHMYLHLTVRDYFLLHVRGAYYRCHALPFGRGLSALWCTKLLHPVVCHQREKWGSLILPCLHNFLVAPAPLGRASTETDCAQAHQRLEKLSRLLGLARHLYQGFWSGGTTREHLVSLWTRSECASTSPMRRSTVCTAWRRRSFFWRNATSGSCRSSFYGTSAASEYRCRWRIPSRGSSRGHCIRIWQLRSS